MIKDTVWGSIQINATSLTRDWGTRIIRFVIYTSKKWLIKSEKFVNTYFA